MTESTPPTTAAAEHEGPIEFDGAGCRYVLVAMPVVIFDPGGPPGDMPSREMRAADLVALLTANHQLRVAVLEGLGECMRRSIAEERMAAGSFQERLLANGAEMLAVTCEGLKLYGRIAGALDRLAPVPATAAEVANVEPSTVARSGSAGGEACACHKCGGAAQVNDGDDGIGPPVCVNCYDAEWVPPQPPAPDSDTVLLLNLLARIHGDGGHRVIAMGVEQACAEADLMVAKWRACDGCSCICDGTCGCPCHDDEPGIDERRAALQGSKP